MDNINFTINLANNELLDLSENQTGKQLISTLVSDDTGAPILSLSIEAKSDDGQLIKITIPFSDSQKASVKIL